MTAVNDVTGDAIQTKTRRAEAKRKYDEGWDRIFGKPSVDDAEVVQPKLSPCQAHSQQDNNE